MKALAYIAGAALLAVIPAALAEDSMSVEPGLWRTSTVMTMSMMPVPQSQQEEQCITREDATFDPDDLMSEAEECTVDSLEQSSTSMTFSMTCLMEGGVSMAGTGSFETANRGRSMSGVIDFAGEVPGFSDPLTMNIEMSGERIGDCDV